MKYIRILPNELTIEIYTNLSFEDTFNALNTFPFLYFTAKEKAKNRNNIWTDSAKEGHLLVIKFLHENRTEGCTKLQQKNIKYR